MKIKNSKLKIQKNKVIDFNLFLSFFYFTFFIFSFLIFNFDFACALTTFDPLSIGGDARSLGMGRATVAVAEGAETLFNNPACLGEFDNFQFTSMSGRILDDETYGLMGIIYPLGNKTAVGFGFAIASVPGIDLYDASGNFQKRADFTSNALIVSFGQKLLDKTVLGLNFKYYLQNSNELQSSNGGGVNLDLGFLMYNPDWLAIGVLGKNILTNVSKIRYQNNEEETLPSSLIVGAKFYLLGNSYAAAIFSPLELFLCSDAELSLNTAQPATLHTGIEVSPNANLSLRAGVDQDAIPGGMQNNLTTGISLKIAGIGFHYAYHTYGDLAQNLSHYFSISFDESGWPPEGPYDIYHAAKP